MDLHAEWDRWKGKTAGKKAGNGKISSPRRQECTVEAEREDEDDKGESRKRKKSRLEGICRPNIVKVPAWSNGLIFAH